MAKAIYVNKTSKLSGVVVLLESEFKEDFVYFIL